MIAVPFDNSFTQNITALLILEASLYANFTTDFGAMSAAEAAMNTARKKPGNDTVVTPAQDADVPPYADF